MARHHLVRFACTVLLFALASSRVSAAPVELEIDGPISRLSVPADRLSILEVDQFELRKEGPTLGISWDAAANFSAINQGFRIVSVGESELGGGLEAAETAILLARQSGELLLVAGVRHDVRPVSATHLAIGVRDVEMWGFEANVSAFLSTRGHVSGRIEVEREVVLGGRLVARPAVQLDLAASDAPSLRGEVGLRLCYVTRSGVSPYVGVEYEHSLMRASTFGSASFAADHPKPVVAFLVGVAFRR
jgi:copper resistance protein B